MPSLAADLVVPERADPSKSQTSGEIDPLIYRACVHRVDAISDRDLCLNSCFIPLGYVLSC